MSWQEVSIWYVDAEPRWFSDMNERFHTQTAIVVDAFRFRVSIDQISPGFPPKLPAPWVDVIPIPGHYHRQDLLEALLDRDVQFGMLEVMQFTKDRFMGGMFTGSLLSAERLRNLVIGKLVDKRVPVYSVAEVFGPVRSGTIDEMVDKIGRVCKAVSDGAIYLDCSNPIFAGFSFLMDKRFDSDVVEWEADMDFVQAFKYALNPIIMQWEELWSD